MQSKLTTSVQINDCENHPLLVNADFMVTKESEGYSWTIARINHIELVIGDKVGIDVTKQIEDDLQAFSIVAENAINCADQIYEAIAEQEAEKTERTAKFRRLASFPDAVISKCLKIGRA